MITEGVYGCEQVNVEKQRRDPQSFLNWLVRMIRQRKETPEIGWGECSVLQTGHKSVLGLMYEWRGNRVVLLHNFSRQPLEVVLRVKGEGGDLLTNLLRRERKPRAGERRASDRDRRVRLSLVPRRRPGLCAATAAWAAARAEPEVMSRAGSHQRPACCS